MAPEQATFNAIDVDTRADIYALGVILYELLTGSTPIPRDSLRRAGLEEMLRVIREVEPPTPSSRISTSDALPSLAAARHIEPARLSRFVRGDLDWIVMKALAKERHRRYDSAIGLANDIERFTNHEPVLAGPPTAGYRLRKFARRNRGQVVAAALVLVSLLGGLMSVLLVEARANASLKTSNEALTEANARATKANAELKTSKAAVQARYDLAVDAIKTFHTGVSEDFLLKEDQFKELRNRLLKSAADFYGKLGGLLDKETDFGSRRALAQSNFELAELTRKVGRPEASLATHRAVLAAREALSAEHEADVSLKVDVGRSLNAVALLLESMAKTGEALTTYRRSESLMEGLAEIDLSASSTLGGCRSSIGQLLFRTNRPAEALRVYRQARNELEKLASAPGASGTDKLELARTIHRIAFLCLYYSQVQEAETEYRAALDIRQRLADDNPNSTEFLLSLAMGHIGLGTAQRYTDKPKDAEANLRRGLTITESLASDHPAVTEFRAARSSTQFHLSLLLNDLGRLKEAELVLRAALREIQALVSENPAIIAYQDSVAMIRTVLGRTHRQIGRLSDAEAECRASLVGIEELGRDYPGHLLLANHLPHVLCELGDVVRSLGRFDEARTLYERLVAVSEPPVVETPNDPEYLVKLVGALWRRGLTRRALGDIAGAVADVRRAVELSDRLPARTATYQVERACSHASLAGLAGQSGARVSAAEGEAAASRGMEWLRRAAEVGYGNVDALRSEPAFDAIRARADFRLLMMDLAFPDDPFSH